MFLLEHLTGIEPAYSAWEANVLPLNHRCSIFFIHKSKVYFNHKIIKTWISPSQYFGWWVLTGSNRRPPVRQTGALPAELNTHWCRLPELNQQPTDYDSVALPD